MFYHILRVLLAILGAFFANYYHTETLYSKGF